ncbi:MAG: UMP kinase [Elusimicrobia bacterium]|nr:UMP kinase [Elusimicrobiota bacterium]
MSEASMYKKIIIKLSGESLGKNGDGIDFSSVDKIISEIVPVYKKGVSIGIVIGGGNIWRGGVNGKLIDKTAADYIGMTTTLINGMVLGERLKSKNIPAKVFSSFGVSNFLQQFTLEKIDNAWKNRNIVIMVGGTGRPHFTTDTASAIFAVESKVELLLKATNVDGLYEDDPKKNPMAKFIKKISYDDAIKKNLKIMDMAAFSLCRQHKIEIIILNFNKSGNILKAVSGKNVGSLIHL